MELLTPGYGLIIFEVIMLTSLVLFVVSWVVILVTRHLEPSKKLVWMAATLFLPFIGPLLFLLSLRAPGSR